MYYPPSSPSRWRRKSPHESAGMRRVVTPDALLYWVWFTGGRLAPAASFFGTPDPENAPLTSLKVVNEDGLEPAADFLAVIGPDPLSPIAVATRLRAQEMKQRVAKTTVAGRNPRLDHFLVEKGTAPFHRPQHIFVTSDPGNTVCPTATLHVKAIVFLL